MKENTTLWMGWGLTVLTALFLLMDAGMKVAGARVSIDATVALGFSADTTRVLGAILLACTLLYLYPRTSLLGAVLVTGYLGGAIAVQLQHRNPLFSNVLFGVYVGLFLWGGIFFRSATLRSLIPWQASCVLLAFILAAPLQSTSAFAGARQEAKVLMASDPASLKFQQDWGFSDAVVTGDTIYLSGVVAGVREGETDLKVAYTRAFERIGAILKSARASWDDVVEITSFHTDLTTQMPAIVAVKNNYVKQPFPAWTAIQVSRLIPSNGITEIKIVAKIPK